MPVITYRDALNQALREEMQRDDRVFLMGEEVARVPGRLQGVEGLLQEFGEMRVVDTPITELGFAGVGVGAAMVGLRPVIEFMTWNFALLALDQVVNAAAKMLYMSGGQYQRCRWCSAGRTARRCSSRRSTRRRGSRWLAHIPGLKVVAPGTPYDAKGLLKSAIRDDNPVVLPRRRDAVQHQGRSARRGVRHPARQGGAEARRRPLLDHHARQDGARRACRPPTSWRRTASASTSSTCARVRPMDVEAIAASVQKTNRAVVLEEGWELCGVGAQVVDFIQRECFDDLDAPVLRVHQADVPMPYAKNLERAAKPDAPKAIAAVKKVMYLDE